MQKATLPAVDEKGAIISTLEARFGLTLGVNALQILFYITLLQRVSSFEKTV